MSENNNVVGELPQTSILQQASTLQQSFTLQQPSTTLQQPNTTLLQQPTTQYFLLPPGYQSTGTGSSPLTGGGGNQGGLGDGLVTFPSPVFPAGAGVLGPNGGREIAGGFDFFWWFYLNLCRIGELVQVDRAKLEENGRKLAKMEVQHNKKKLADKIGSQR